MARIAKVYGYNSVKDLLSANEVGSSAENSFESVDESLTLSNPGESSEDKWSKNTI